MSYSHILCTIFTSRSLSGCPLGIQVGHRMDPAQALPVGGILGLHNAFPKPVPLAMLHLVVGRNMAEPESDPVKVRGSTYREIGWQLT